MVTMLKPFRRRLESSWRLLKLEWKMPSPVEVFRIVMSGGDPSVPQGTLTQAGIRLHVGAGQTVLAGYENLDGYPNPERSPAFPTKATKIVRAEILDEAYEANSVNEIRCHHVFEHISLLDLDRTLRGWNRILRPAGLLWIEVPDFEACARKILTLKDEAAKEVYFRHIFGSQIGPGEYHLNGLTAERLIFLLREYGFAVNVAYTEWTLRHPSKPTFMYKVNAPLPDLTVKAIKTGPPSPELEQAEWTAITYRKLYPNPELTHPAVAASEK